jgi:hypothetical protein
VQVCLGMSVFGSMLWDRLCVAIFAPKLLWVGYVDAWEALPPWNVMLYAASKYVFLAAVLVVYGKIASPETQT